MSVRLGYLIPGVLLLLVGLFWTLSPAQWFAAQAAGARAEDAEVAADAQSQRVAREVPHLAPEIVNEVLRVGGCDDGTIAMAAQIPGGKQD